MSILVSFRKCDFDKWKYAFIFPSTDCTISVEIYIVSFRWINFAKVKICWIVKWRLVQILGINKRAEEIVKSRHYKYEYAREYLAKFVFRYKRNDV